MTMSIQDVLGTLGASVHHIGFVTDDLEETIRQQQRLLGAAFGEIKVTGPLDIVRPDIGATVVTMRQAFAQFGPLTLELIEPQPGPSIYRDHLDRFGPGVHHLGFDVDDVPRFLDVYSRLGVQASMTGQRSPDGAVFFAYFDTRNALGVLTEVVDFKGAARQRAR